jgi:hypothetical protein
MPHKADDDLQERLWALPHVERCALLTLSVMAHHPMMPHTAYAMLDLLMKIASGLGEVNRAKLAEEMHGAADYLEGCVRPTTDDAHAVH